MILHLDGYYGDVNDKYIIQRGIHIAEEIIDIVEKSIKKRPQK